MNPLCALANYGQAIWLDHFDRELLQGKLGRLIEQDALKGLTSNPSILGKAFSGAAYEAEIESQSKDCRSAKELYEAMALEELRAAADIFRPLYEGTEHLHGWVSLEVDPRLANDVEATFEEGQRLFQQLARPNAFVKVPATAEGVIALERLIRSGVNVNVTLLFGLPRYREVVEAYVRGIERRIEDGNPVEDVRSVASFFLSRIDSAIDPTLRELSTHGGSAAALAAEITGGIAIASAKLAHQIYRELHTTQRYKRLTSRGARPQWLLWASTSTKDPSYDELKYVEALIGRETINTLPPKTLDAYRRHGKPADRLTENIEQSRVVLNRLAEVGIDIDKVTAELETQGVEKFRKPFNDVLALLDRRLRA